MGKGQAPSPKEHSLPPTMQRNATQSSSKRGSRSLKRESNEKLLTGSAKKRRVSSSCSGSSSASVSQNETQQGRQEQPQEEVQQQQQRQQQTQQQHQQQKGTKNEEKEEKKDGKEVKGDVADTVLQDTLREPEGFGFASGGNSDLEATLRARWQESDEQIRNSRASRTLF